MGTCCYHCLRLSFNSDSHGRAWGFARRQSQRHVKTTIDSVIYGDVSRIECVVVTLATSQKMWSVMLYAPRRICEFASSFSALLCHRLWYRTCHYFVCVVVKYCTRVLEVQQGNLQEKKEKTDCVECKLLQRSIFMCGSFHRAPALEYSFVRWRSEHFFFLYRIYFSVCHFNSLSLYIVDLSLELCVKFCCF